MTPSSDSKPTAVELLATIRKTIDEWHTIYARDTGEVVLEPYLASLGNDIAWELGIMEAINKSRSSTTSDLGGEAG